MLIRSVKITNYKSFHNPEKFDFSSGFNVIVGENNSGKTALLEALTLSFEAKPHQSKHTILYVGDSLADYNSYVYVSFFIDLEELDKIMANHNQNFYIPFQANQSKEAIENNFWHWAQKVRIINCTLAKENKIESAYLEGFDDIKNQNNAYRFSFVKGDTRPKFEALNANIDPQQFLPFRLTNILKQRIYAFRAERFHVGQSNFGTSNLLAPDASNLPEVLNNLQGFPNLFKKYNDLVKQVFPRISQVSVRSISAKEVKIFILTQSDVEREDLAVPLQDSGTGIGQVLAILYVVFMAEFPRTIIIDEPQSFLHPGATRRLFSILKLYPQHQYIVTTHSPIVINAADPQSLLLVRKQNEESTIEVIDRSQKQALETVLAEVGARLSDVFGADNILWVEGDTEELCFPLILSKICNQPLLGTVVLGVIHTGDFDSKHSKTIFRIYNKLSKSAGLLPSAIGFIFDREGRTQKEQEDLIRQSRVDQGKQTVFFTPRRMFENYLLNPEAIAWVMSGLDWFSNEKVSPNSIQEWIDSHRWDSALFKPKSRVPNLEKRTNELWLETVNGAKLLQGMFQHFSDNRYDYINDKKTYGLALTEWIVENSPEDLIEIADLIIEALGRAEGEK